MGSCRSMAADIALVGGALVHNASSVLAVMNAALLYDRDFTGKKRRKA